jgi:transcriptional regulator with XRE-family HTH domain
MEDVVIRKPGQARRTAQARYLSDLVTRRHLSAREIARRSELVAADLGKPELAVGHQAVSAWVNGTRHPNAEHKKMLATILDAPLASLAQACDADAEPLSIQSIFRPVTVVVYGTFRNYEYRLAVKREIDMTQPAIYQHWADIFSTRPAYLMRHLRHISYDLFGWIPDHSASPMVHNPRCLVPLERVPGRATLGLLDAAASSHRRVWFVYLPDGKLHVGIGYRERSSFSFARNNGTGVSVESYPLSRVELVGYFSGNALFHLLPASSHGSSPTIVTMPPRAAGS